MEELELRHNRFCPSHARAYGKLPDGSFRSRTLQAYPSSLNLALARCAVLTAQAMRERGVGPSGWRAVSARPQRRLLYSQEALQGEHGIVWFNEAFMSGERHEVTERQSAVYVHVDDGVAVSTGRCSSGGRLSATSSWTKWPRV